MSNLKLTVIAAVAVLLLAGAGGYYAFVYDDGSGPDDEGGGPVTITDSTGEEIVIQLPVTAVSLTNTNAAKFMQILGVADLVTAADSNTIELLDNIYGNVSDLGSYSTPDGETVLSTGSTILICQSSARSLTNAEALEALGIQIVRLD